MRTRAGFSRNPAESDTLGAPQWVAPHHFGQKSPLSKCNSPRHGAIRAEQRCTFSFLHETKSRRDFELGEPSLSSRCGRFLQLVESRKNLRTVSGGIDTGVHLGNLARRIDQECMSRRELHNSEVGEGTVRIRHSVIRVREQLEVQAFLCAELLVR